MRFTQLKGSPSTILCSACDPLMHGIDCGGACGLRRMHQPELRELDLRINDLAGDDICFALSWSGDVSMASHRAAEANKHFEIRYFIPKGGAPVWFDMMAIPKDAPHTQAALEWINYIERPEVHAAITNEVFYPNADAAARKFFRPEILHNPTVYPSPDVLKTLFLMKPLPAEIKRLESRLWAQLKSGG